MNSIEISFEAYENVEKQELSLTDFRVDCGPKQCPFLRLKAFRSMLSKATGRGAPTRLRFMAIGFMAQESLTRRRYQASEAGSVSFQGPWLK